MAGILLLGCSAARAQYANHSVGLSVGVMNFLFERQGLNRGPFVGLEGSIYIENGWDVVSLSKIVIPYDSIAGKFAVGLAPSIGVRYLFSEERIRPYAGADLSWLFLFRDSGTASLFGVGPNLGIDFFVSDSVSLGLRIQYVLYFQLNGPFRDSLDGSLGVAAYF